MDLQCFHSRSRLKIRRGPSCKISSSQTSSASFHGSCAAREMKKKGIFKQPLIFHTFEPEIILTEPAKFMSLVQRLTGSAHTRRLVRTSMRKAKEMQSSSGIEDEQLIMQQGMHSMHQRRKDPLKEGSTIILAPTYPNPNDHSIKHAPELPLSSHANNPPLSPASSNNYTPLAAPLSSDTIKNHPSSSLSSNSAISEENPFTSSSGTIMNMSKESSQLLPSINPQYNPKTPFSSSCLHDKNLEPSLPLTSKPNNSKSLIIDNNQISPNFSNCVHTSTPMSIIIPLPAKASDELSNTSRGPPWSPVTPNSSLTTSSEGEHTDNLLTEGGASTYREALIAICREEEGNTLMNEAEEDAHFFFFSGDSYYGSSYEAAQDDELEFQYRNVLDSVSMHSEALSFFKDNTLEEEAL